MSISAEHQDFFIFLQRLVSPVLEAYSGAAIFIHSLIQPTSESDYTQKLFRYLLTRTERGLAVYGNSTKSSPTKSDLMLRHLIILLNYISKSLFSGISTPIYKIHERSNILYLMNLLSLPGESATHYLVKNTVRTFKELGVSKLQCLECF